MSPEYLHIESVNSTNDLAKELLVQKNFVIVTSDYQTKGRGRNGKVWFGDEKKNFFCSVGIKHEEKKTFAEIIAYQYRACLAVLYTLKENFLQQKFALKYPNDVYANENGIAKKISGILIENDFQGDFCSITVAGIGVNISQESFPQELEATATSLFRLGENISTENFREKFFPILKKFLLNSHEEIISDWKKELNLIGKKIFSVNDNKEFFVRNFDETGRIYAEIGTESRVFDNSDTIRYAIL